MDTEDLKRLHASVTTIFIIQLVILCIMIVLLTVALAP
jgi:hypothetical protein